ncbi:MAG: DUF2161 family putative PD-(D/E)XK-type phosphodiesterase [Pseudomonadota bacterium]
MRETDLYPPVKAHLEKAGYHVKSEVGPVDVMGVKDGGPPVIVELKSAFSLTLLHQAVARLSVTDDVYVAVARPKSYKALQANVALCRRLGVGVMTIRPHDALLEVHCPPGPYAPRKSRKKGQRLQNAFDRLQGDPNMGGATRHGLVTGYRQDAVKCAAYLAQSGAEKGSIVARATGVPQATTLMRDNHYGWFQRVEIGVYDLTAAGQRGLADWGDIVDP